MPPLERALLRVSDRLKSNVLKHGICGWGKRISCEKTGGLNDLYVVTRVLFRTKMPFWCRDDCVCVKMCSGVNWATVCKTVRPMLSDRCLSCPVSLSVMLAYCGQTVGWIKMKLGTEVGLDPGHIVLGGDPAPPQKAGTAPNFRLMSIVPKRLDGSRCHLVRR